MNSPRVREPLFPFENSYFLVLQSFLALLSDSVPVSVREGEMMRFDKGLSFFKSNAAWKSKKAQKYGEQSSRKNLDTIVAAESLFKGTVVDFGSDLHFGGGNYARYDCTIS
jgi:hypothetical protein